jgi:protein tyrosine phosphatase (PTP) superfamily phosphohydrolase (DUF442 family)
MCSLSAARRCSLAFAALFVFSLCGCCSAVSTQRVVVACTNNTGSAIPKFCVATPNLLWGGGRPDKDDAGWLMQQGIRTMINLEMLHDDRSALSHATVPPDRRYVVGYFRVHDWEPLPMIAPSLEDDRVARFLAIVSQQPAPVFVHCRCGMKRTAVMIAAYRVVIENVSAEKAIAEMWRYGGAWSKPDSNYIRAMSRRRDEMRRRIAEWTPRLKRDAQVVCADGRCSVSDH